MPDNIKRDDDTQPQVESSMTTKDKLDLVGDMLKQTYEPDSDGLLKDLVDKLKAMDVANTLKTSEKILSKLISNNSIQTKD